MQIFLLMSRQGKIFWLLLATVVLTVTCRAGERLTVPSADSLKAELYRVYLQAENYDKAVASYENSKDTTLGYRKTYVSLVKKAEGIHFTLDSLRLVLARLYVQYKMPDQAETAFGDLVKSSYRDTRNYAIRQLDSLLRKKEKEFYEEYPFSPVFEVVKPVLPFAALLILAAGVAWLTNRNRGKRMIGAFCNIEAENVLYHAALKFEREKIAGYNERNAHSILVDVTSSPLPFAEPELPAGFETISAIVVPEKYNAVLKFVMGIGLRPAYSLDIIVDKGDTNCYIMCRLKKGRDILAEWNAFCAAEAYFDTRFDVAYRALIEIQKVGG
jgi:hypothetical protein